MKTQKTARKRKAAERVNDEAVAGTEASDAGKGRDSRPVAGGSALEAGHGATEGVGGAERGAAVAEGLAGQHQAPRAALDDMQERGVAKTGLNNGHGKPAGYAEELCQTLRNIPLDEPLEVSAEELLLILSRRQGAQDDCYSGFRIAIAELKIGRSKLSAMERKYLRNYNVMINSLEIALDLMMDDRGRSSDVITLDRG